MCTFPVDTEGVLHTLVADTEGEVIALSTFVADTGDVVVPYTYLKNVELHNDDVLGLWLTTTWPIGTDK